MSEKILYIIIKDKFYFKVIFINMSKFLLINKLIININY